MPQQFSPLLIVFRFLEDVSIVYYDFSKFFKFGRELISYNKSKGFGFEVKIEDRLLERFETKES